MRDYSFTNVIISPQNYTFVKQKAAEMTKKLTFLAFIFFFPHTECQVSMAKTGDFALPCLPFQKKSLNFAPYKGMTQRESGATIPCGRTSDCRALALAAKETARRVSENACIVSSVPRFRQHFLNFRQHFLLRSVHFRGAM